MKVYVINNPGKKFTDATTGEKRDFVAGAGEEHADRYVLAGAITIYKEPGMVAAELPESTPLVGFPESTTFVVG